MRVAFLVSGELGENVLSHFIKNLEVIFVLTDKNSRGIIENCERNNIPVYIGNPRKEKIKDFISELECDVIASVNYLFLIDRKFIQLAKGLIFNIHGSLLPRYRGRTPHVWAIINGETKTGITAHCIDKGCDTGAIIEQISIDIAPEDTGAIILEKFKRLYIPLVEKVFKLYEDNKIKLVLQDESKATFFGKRTPDDGKIDWNWSVNRIINWVRAQAYPYPGAFAMYKDERIIVNKASISDYGFHFKVMNGTILSTSPLVIKCATGAIQLDDVISPKNNLQINEVLT